VTKGKGRNAAGNLAMAATELGITLEDTPVETMEGVDSEEESEPEVRFHLHHQTQTPNLSCQGFLHAPYRILCVENSHPNEIR
jgi:hypothetical protein